MKKLTVALIGAGMRGDIYTSHMCDHPEEFEVVAVAEPIAPRRQKIQKRHGVTDEHCFETGEELLARPKMADIALICTQDHQHYAHAMRAIELGYDILLEKPVAPTAEQCANLARAAKEKGVKVLVCHVLRYTSFFGKVKQIILDGILGDIQSVIHVEAVGHVHQSHSYVRGNWHSEQASSPMLLAKSCHDIDILQWLLDKPCRKVQSFGRLSYFKAENAPEGAPVRCIDGGCPIADTCPYNCSKLYLEREDTWFRPVCTRGIAKGEVPTDEEVLTALKTTDYGLCVFHANNDVVDHQVVNMEFEGGTTVSFTMNAFNEGGRYIRLFGTKGELYANMSGEEITVFTLDDRKQHTISMKSMDESILNGHGGGDGGLVAEAHAYFSGDYSGFRAADIETSVKNHLICFAAEQARHNDTVENVDAFFESYGMEND